MAPGPAPLFGRQSAATKRRSIETIGATPLYALFYALLDALVILHMSKVVFEVQASVRASLMDQIM